VNKDTHLCLLWKKRRVAHCCRCAVDASVVDGAVPDPITAAILTLVDRPTDGRTPAQGRALIASASGAGEPASDNALPCLNGHWIVEDLPSDCCSPADDSMRWRATARESLRRCKPPGRRTYRAEPVSRPATPADATTTELCWWLPAEYILISAWCGRVPEAGKMPRWAVRTERTACKSDERHVARKTILDIARLRHFEERVTIKQWWNWIGEATSTSAANRLYACYADS